MVGPLNRRSICCAGDRFLLAIADRFEDSAISSFFLVCDMRRAFGRAMRGRWRRRARGLLSLGGIKCERDEEFPFARVRFWLIASDG